MLHVMPFLPGSDFERDFHMFRQLFTNPDFMPDELKIYPTQVIAGTRLHEMTLSGEYAPPSEGELIELLSRVKKELVPEFVRIKRVLRDIPATVVEAGSKRTNLRQLLSKRGCNCIRCREIGHKVYKEGIKPDVSKAELRTVEYAASGGKEVFLSFIEPDCDALIGILRLRLSENATIRELRLGGGNRRPSHHPAPRLWEEAHGGCRERGKMWGIWGNQSAQRHRGAAVLQEARLCSRGRIHGETFKIGNPRPDARRRTRTKWRKKYQNSVSARQPLRRVGM